MPDTSKQIPKKRPRDVNSLGKQIVEANDILDHGPFVDFQVQGDIVARYRQEDISRVLRKSH